MLWENGLGFVNEKSAHADNSLADCEHVYSEYGGYATHATWDERVAYLCALLWHDPWERTRYGGGDAKRLLYDGSLAELRYFQHRCFDP